MANTRNTDFTLIDYSDEIELIPRGWSLLASMNMFDVHNVSTTVAQVERIQEISTLFDSRERSAERNYIGSENAQTYNLNIPFFPLDRQITAADVQNFRKYGSGEDSKTLADEVTRVMARIVRSFSLNKEAAFVEALKGTSYSGPGKAAEYNYYTTFGVSQPLAPVDFTDATTNPAAVVESDARLKITTAAQDEASEYTVVAICGPKWFSGLIAHPLVVQDWVHYSSAQDPLRSRLGGMGNYRSFTYRGVTYIEYPNPRVDEGEAYIFPVGISEMFRVYYGPADDAAMANEVGREMYMFYKESAFDRKYKVEAETTMLAVNCRPELVYKSVGNFV